MLVERCVCSRSDAGDADDGGDDVRLLGARKMEDLKVADLKKTDQMERKMGEMKLAENDRPNFQSFKVDIWQKKKSNLLNEARIKACINKFDSGSVRSLSVPSP